MSARESGRLSGLSERPHGLPFRLAWLHGGLALFGVSLALLVRARLGLDPWDVLSQGIARQLGVRIGWVVDGLGAVVLLAWIPLRQRPGIGTVSNVILVGLVLNAALRVIPAPSALPGRVAMLAGAIGLNAVATGCYLGARLGPGPRDGLMTGLVARGYSLRVVRTAIELSVLAAGLALGGSVGPGTAAYAISIGALIHLVRPHLLLGTRENQPPERPPVADKPPEHTRRAGSGPVSPSPAGSGPGTRAPGRPRLPALNCPR